jgi:Trk K+ transport system NAD-binding subunit
MSSAKKRNGLEDRRFANEMLGEEAGDPLGWRRLQSPREMPMDDFYLVCGLGRVGARVLDYLQAAGMKAAVVDFKVDAGDPALRGAQAIRGDYRNLDTLKQAGLDRAKGVLILSSDDLANLSTTLAVAGARAEIPIVVRMFNPTLIGRLGPLAGRVTALSTSQLTAPILSRIALTGAALGTFTLADGAVFQVAERTVETNAASPQESASALRSLGLQSIALSKQDGSLRLAAAGPAEAIQRWLGTQEDAREPAWAGWVRRQTRAVRRLFGDIELPVKIASATLAVVILASVIIFHFGMKNDTIIDAFYRTVSLIATGADMHGNDVEPGSWQKAFVSILRLIGVALTASFTAIITNYLIRANLGAALEARRIPERGHVVVCGLGNVGFRVLQDLIRQGRSVVAIERYRDNPFVATARRLGAAVVIGDGTVREVLRQANAPTSLALIAATNNELANLEIVLLARELEPSLRVVLRLIDPQLARTLRETADIRLALSIPELAAPAFVAALFGDRLRGVMLIDGTLYAAVELTVQADDAHLLGRSVRSLEVDFSLLPLRLTGEPKAGVPQLRDASLAVGDCLAAIIAFSDLQRLMGRERPASTWSVEATTWPISAKDGLKRMLRNQFGIDEGEAERRLGTSPVVLADGKTRGEAEDLCFRLDRERVVATARSM